MSASNVLGQGRTALVTGASRGIGPLVAAQIARQGGHVVLTGRSAADLKAVAAELAAEARGGRVIVSVSSSGAVGRPGQPVLMIGTQTRPTCGRIRCPCRQAIPAAADYEYMVSEPSRRPRAVDRIRHRRRKASR